MSITDMTIEHVGTDTSTWVVARVADIGRHTMFAEIHFRLSALKSMLNFKGINSYHDRESAALYIENVSDRYITLLTLKYPRFKFVRFDSTGKLYIPTGSSRPGARVNI